MADDLHRIDTRARRPLALGFIGGGLGSVIGTAHATASRLDNRFELVAGCFSRDAAVSRASGERYGVSAARCGHDWRAWLERERARLDAVAILTPIPDHADMIRHALELGVPVIGEKALVANTGEADALAAAIGGRRHFLAVTLNYSGYPIVRRLRRLIRDGELGRLRQLRLEMPLENFRRIPVGDSAPARAQPWRQIDGAVPTVMLDLGVHLQHLLHYLTDEPIEEVMGELHRSGGAGSIVDEAELWLRGRDDLRASMWMSKSALGQRNGLRLRVFGEHGSADWLQTDPETLRLADRHGRRHELDRGNDDALLATPHWNRFKAGHPSGYVEAFANLYWDIADALEAHRAGGDAAHPEVFGLAHSRDGLAVLEAGVRSHESGRWRAVERAAPHQARAA